MLYIINVWRANEVSIDDFANNQKDNATAFDLHITIHQMAVPQPADFIVSNYAFLP